MRTTLEIDDAVLAAARALADQDRISLGAAVSRLAARGVASAEPAVLVNGFPTFHTEPGDKPITLEMVNAYRDE